MNPAPSDTLTNDQTQTRRLPGHPTHNNDPDRVIDYRRVAVSAIDNSTVCTMHGTHTKRPRYRICTRGSIDREETADTVFILEPSSGTLRCPAEGLTGRKDR